MDKNELIKNACSVTIKDTRGSKTVEIGADEIIKELRKTLQVELSDVKSISFDCVGVVGTNGNSDWVSSSELSFSKNCAFDFSHQGAINYEVTASYCLRLKKHDLLCIINVENS